MKGQIVVCHWILCLFPRFSVIIFCSNIKRSWEFKSYHATISNNNDLEIGQGNPWENFHLVIIAVVHQPKEEHSSKRKVYWRPCQNNGKENWLYLIYLKTCLPWKSTVSVMILSNCVEAKERFMLIVVFCLLFSNWSLWKDNQMRKLCRWVDWGYGSWTYSLNDVVQLPFA